MPQTEPDLKGWDGAFLRVVDTTRFIERYMPLPGEFPQILDELRTNLELQRDGWQTLDNANLANTNLARANLSGISLAGANLFKANLAHTNLDQACLVGANLTGANFAGARLTSSNLTGANLRDAHLCDADLTGAWLNEAILVDTTMIRTNLTACHVYGISAWNLKTNGAQQQDLIITKREEPTITVDNLEMAQFVYLLLNNERIREVIDSITSKVVLILGRFTTDRKIVLDMLRNELRHRDYLPILFDFEKPASRDLTETISTLAHMSRFIIADLTDARSIPQELHRLIPDLPSVPVQPILLASQHEYAMFEHFRRYPWVLDEFLYADATELLAALFERVIQPAEGKLKAKYRGGTAERS
jgi:uncharacterized protein YjbI with pentapeptide repeats